MAAVFIYLGTALIVKNYIHENQEEIKTFEVDTYYNENSETIFKRTETLRNIMSSRLIVYAGIIAFYRVYCMELMNAFCV